MTIKNEESATDIFSNIKYILGDTRNPYGMVFIFLLLAVLDVAGVGMVPVLIHSVLSGDAGGETGRLLSMVFNITDQNDLLLIVSGILLVLFSLKTVVFLWSNYAVYRFSYNVMHQNRAELIDLALDSRYEMMSNKSTADIINLLQLHINQAVSNYLVPFLKLVSDLLVAAGIFLFLVVSMPKATLSLLALLVFVISLYLFLMRQKLYDYGRSTYIHNLRMIDLAKAIRVGFVDIIVNNGKAYFGKFFTENSFKFSGVQLKSAFLRLVPRAGLEWIVIVFILVLIFLTGRGGDKTELITVLATFGVASIRLLPVSSSIAASLTLFRNTEAVVLKYIQERESLSEQAKQSHKSRAGKIDNINIDKNSKAIELTLKNASFSYNNNKNILNNISLHLKRGKTIGIIGESGAGKSTLISLIMGLLTPTSGSVLINGMDMTHLDPSHFFSYIPQFPFISNDTIINNLSFSEQDVSEDIMLKTMDDIGLKDLVNGNVAELNTVVGEKGVKLSGGQIQRIALVRALIRDMPFLVIDEATSALDSVSSGYVIETLRKIKKDTAMLIVTHRKDVLMICDDVYELSEGGLRSVDHIVKTS